MTNFYSNLIYLICFLIWFSKRSFTVIKSRLDCVCISIYVSQGCRRQLSKYLPRLFFKAAFVLQGRLKEKKKYLFLKAAFVSVPLCKICSPMDKLDLYSIVILCFVSLDFWECQKFHTKVYEIIQLLWY